MIQQQKQVRIVLKALIKGRKPNLFLYPGVLFGRQLVDLEAAGLGAIGLLPDPWRFMTIICVC